VQIGGNRELCRAYPRGGKECFAQSPQENTIKLTHSPRDFVIEIKADVLSKDCVIRQRKKPQNAKECANAASLLFPDVFDRSEHRAEDLQLQSSQ